MTKEEEQEIAARQHRASVQRGHHIDTLPAQLPLPANRFPLRRRQARFDCVGGHWFMIEPLPADDFNALHSRGAK
jgi:hypothetical protein